MEFTLANVISNLLVLQLKYLNGDIDNFFSSVKFVLQTLLNYLSTKCSEMAFITNHDQPLIHQELLPSSSCSTDQTLADDDRTRVHVSEINSMMDYLEGSSNGDESLGEEDLLGLFDEEEPSLEEIKETFEVFDANKDGFIDACELQRVLVCVLDLKGHGCNLEECKRMIRSFDANGDGLIDFQEFVIFMEKCLC